MRKKLSKEKHLSDKYWQVKFTLTFIVAFIILFLKPLVLYTQDRASAVCNEKLLKDCIGNSKLNTKSSFSVNYASIFKKDQRGNQFLKKIMEVKITRLML